MARMRLSSVTTSTKFHKPRGLSRAIEAGGRITKRTSSRYRFGDHIGRFEAAEFTPSLFRAHVTARELASPPFEDVYIRACTNPGHPESASNMTTWVNSQFPRPDFHRQVQRHYGLQNDSRPLYSFPCIAPFLPASGLQARARTATERPSVWRRFSIGRQSPPQPAFGTLFEPAGPPLRALHPFLLRRELPRTTIRLVELIIGIVRNGLQAAVARRRSSAASRRVAARGRSARVRRRCQGLIVARSNKRWKKVALRPIPPLPALKNAAQAVDSGSNHAVQHVQAKILESVLDRVAVDPGLLKGPGDWKLDLGILEDVRQDRDISSGRHHGEAGHEVQVLIEIDPALDADRRDVSQGDDQAFLVDLPADDPDRDRVAEHQERTLLLPEDAEDLFGQRSRHELDRVEQHVAVDLRLGI